MRSRFVSALLLILSCDFSLAAGSFVHRDQKILRDTTGEVLKLRGVNLGGWLLWEGWIWGDGFKSQTTIFNKLAELSSKEDAARFRDEIYKNFIGEEDIKQIAAHKLNVVRVPFNSRIFDTVAAPSEYKGVGWQILDSLLRWCNKYHVYAVLDMHGCPGGQNPYFISDALSSKTTVWKQESMKQRTVDLWKAIAQRYKRLKIVAGYDLLNEPIPGKDGDLLDLYMRIIAGIREVDKDHLIILEGADFAKKFSFFKRLPDENMAFSFHLYTWFGGKPQNKVTPYVELENRLNVPIWCGEWGENTYEVIGSTLKEFESPANNFSGWCFWTWKKVPNSYTSLVGIASTDNWKMVIECIKHPKTAPKPSRELAVKAMDEFVKASRYSSCHPDTKLMGILSSY